MYNINTVTVSRYCWLLGTSSPAPAPGAQLCGASPIESAAAD